MANPNEPGRPQPPGPHQKLPVEIRMRDAWAVLRLLEASLMDPAVIDALGQHVDRLLAEGNRNLIIDFREVEYISSSMVGVLVGTRQSVVRAGGKLVLCGLNARLHELLKITRLEKMFVVKDDVESALI